jgi:predicted ABC-type ATPase
VHNQPTTSSYVHHLGFQGLKKIIIIAGPNGAGKTTFAKDFLPGLSYVRKIQLWQRLGYQVKLWFLSLPNADAAVARVAQRVMQGGHNIPEDVIRRRFKSGLDNFHYRYKLLVDSWVLYDNYVRPPKLLDWSDR